MIALAIALGYVATLAFVAFTRWLSARGDADELAVRVMHLEEAAASPPETVDAEAFKQVQDTVTTLAAQAGLTRRASRA